MEIKPVGNKYTVIQQNNGKFLAVMILSEHDNFDDAFDATFKATKQESKNVVNKEIEDLKKQGIRAVSFEEAVKDLMPEQLERFLQGRSRKFIKPLLNMNIEMLEQKRKRLKIKPAK